MSTQPYPQQSYPMETYPGYRAPGKRREPLRLPKEPYGRPRRKEPEVTRAAVLGIAFGILLCVVGAGLSMYRPCSDPHDDPCYEYVYWPQVVGYAGLTVGIMVLTVSVVIMIFSPEPRTDRRVFPLGNLCPTCYAPMVWVPQYQRWFCQYCQKYA